MDIAFFVLQLSGIAPEARVAKFKDHEAAYAGLVSDETVKVAAAVTADDAATKATAARKTFEPKIAADIRFLGGKVLSTGADGKPVLYVADNSPIGFRVETLATDDAEVPDDGGSSDGGSGGA